MNPALTRVVALCLLCWLSPVPAADLGWLTGLWELRYDPDDNPKDWVEFEADGGVVSISPEGRRVSGRYTVEGDEVRTLFDVDGVEVPLTLRCSTDKSRLIMPARRSSGFVLYSKVR